MRFHAGALLSRRFLALSAGGAVAGVAALNGCALQAPGGAGAYAVGAMVSSRKSTGRSTLAVAVMSTCVTSAGTSVAHLQAAASVMWAIPILLIFLVIQRGFVAGMSTSGLK
ncbi:hypothetical protein ABT173_42795 [Streptomyces sp. NPDC001795]|uniref:hypothetical protein n=1 Tax=Streptomyces sp. NPDC001795 TaxID=3154525 RepID=UPI00331E3A3C